MAERNVARASAGMAIGTVVSRVTGFGRLLMLAATIGTALNADLFNNANTVPNALYILVAGGVFNVVLVPQLVRAMRNDADGGDAYANRVITLGLLMLGVEIPLSAVQNMLRQYFFFVYTRPGRAAFVVNVALVTFMCKQVRRVPTAPLFATL